MDVTELINDILENSLDVWQYSQKIEGYLALIFNSFYTGQVDKTLENQKSALGMLLKELHELVENGKEFTCEAHETLQKIIEIRCRTKSEEATDKMRQDYSRFLLIRKQRNKRIKGNEEATKNKSKKLKTIAELHDQSFWGTAQQLRSGKVVGDFLGGLDPVFGVLLNVTGGRIGKGDTPWFHNFFFKEEYPLAYHAAVHDAFGYLITYHGKGPGYNYIKSKWTLFNSASPMSCQVAGYRFWKRLMNKPDEIDVF